MADDTNPARVLPLVPLRGNRRVFALVVVPDCGVWHQPPRGQVFFHGLAGAGVFGPVFDRARARIWPCAGLPAGGWAGEPDCALAAGRSGLCVATATAGRNTVEHR